MTTQPAAKMCTTCGCDCSKIERFKDPQGRYFCGSCHKALRAAAAAARQPVAAAVAAPLEIPPEQESIGFSFDEPEPAHAAAAKPPRACSNCGRLLGSAIVCTSCGFNTETGKLLSTVKAKAGKGRKCSKCGYSLAGLDSALCPECGTINVPKSRRDRDREDSSKVVRNEYIKPVLMMAIGLGVSLAIANSQGFGMEASIIYLIKYAIFVPFGVLGFFLCCMIWIGFDAPMHLTAMRLAGIYAVVDAVDATLELMPLPIVLITWLVPAVLYIILLSQILDLELVDAFLLALVTFFIRMGVFIMIAAYAVAQGFI
jgi:hypothetical protein